jgi:hypothetical protein
MSWKDHLDAPYMPALLALAIIKKQKTIDLTDDDLAAVEKDKLCKIDATYYGGSKTLRVSIAEPPKREIYIAN